MSVATIPKLVFDSGDGITTAVISPPAPSDVVISRDELERASTEAAQTILSLLKSDFPGIDGQPVVSMALPNGLGFVLAFLGVVATGAIAAPLNPAYTIPEYEFYLSDSRAGVLVVDSVNANEAFPGVMAARKLGIPICSLTVHQESQCSIKCSIQLVKDDKHHGSGGTKASGWTPTPPRPDTLALILHTSGTTGKPKAVPLSHGNLCHSALNVARAYDLGADDRGYLIQVLFHIHGIVAGLLAPLVSGGSVVVPDKFDANVAWIQFASSKCSWLSGTPSALQILLHAPKAGPDLGIKFLRSCSSPLLPSTFKELQDVFRCPVLDAYAMTENAHQMTTNTQKDAHAGCVGKASGTVRLSLFGEESTSGPLPADCQGEVCITGPSVTNGYLENPEANTKAFFTDAEGTRWFRTGDIGIIDSQTNGHLRIVGRKSEIINRGGEKISPPEVDEAMMLCAAPHVREAACFAVPDDFFGQEIEAALVLAQDAPSDLRSETEIRRLLEDRLAPFKIPKRIHFFQDKIPKGPTGKIQRIQLSKTMSKRVNGQAARGANGIDANQLPGRIMHLIANDLRSDPSGVKPEVTLLELGADSMNLTRLLGNLRHLGCTLAMADVMLNPTVQQVVNLCMKSYARGKAENNDVSAATSTGQVEVPPPFSVLEEFVVDSTAGISSLGDVLASVSKQTGLQVSQLEDVLPLSLEAKWFHDGTITDKWGMKGTQMSYVTIGSPIQGSVDIDRLKWAFGEAAKVEPMPRTYIALEPVTGQWLQVIAKPDVAPLNWHEWSAASEQAVYDRLQKEHEGLRYVPGCRVSKLLLVEHPNEHGEKCRQLYFVDSHVFTDNTSRARLRDNVVKLYLGQATVEDLPQKPLPTAVLIHDSLRRARDNYASKAKFWEDDEKSHAIQPRPLYIPPPESLIKAVSQWTVKGFPTASIWTGDLKGLTVALGLTAPTLVQAAMPLAVAAYEYQGTRELPKSVGYAYGSSSRNPKIPNVDQTRGFGMFASPLRVLLAPARQSLWLHLQQATLKLADLDAHRILVESRMAGHGRDIHIEYTWREAPAGSLWSNVIEAGPERFSAEFPGCTTVLCVRLGIDTIMLIDGEAEEYIQWRSERGFSVSLLEVLRRCLTFLCENKDEIVNLTLQDLVKAVWSRAI